LNTLLLITHFLSICRLSKIHFFKFGLFIFLILFFVAETVVAKNAEVEVGISEYTDTGHSKVKQQPKKASKKSKSTTDHSKLKELQGPFFSGPEVTKACLECHNEAGHQFMNNKHWTWDYQHPKTGQHLGKSVL